jgi:transcriptional regulator with XRE-family HTH domain
MLMLYCIHKSAFEFNWKGCRKMFNAVVLGEKLKSCRKAKYLTQEEAAEKIGVSGQAVSKWEKGECLPDVYNLRLLGQLYRTSLDSLLDMDNEQTERVIETIKINGAVFDVIEKPETILAGKIIYAKDYTSTEDFYSAFNETIKSIAKDENQKRLIYDKVTDCTQPVCDISLSVNFWKDVHLRAYGFVRETVSERQPEGVDVYKMPASLYIRIYADKAAAQLLTKEVCEIWELFHYIRDFFMPTHGFKMAENGAQELEVYNNSEHKSGYAYMPVMRL